MAGFEAVEARLRKRETMGTREGYNVAMHFLIYTRSASFDYQWVYGLDDKPFETALQEYILKWLGTNLLANLRPVTTFFTFRGYHTLMIAEESDTRTDPQERPIFQRAIFMWEPTEGLFYKHLEPLANRLTDEAQKIYRELPNDIYRLQAKARQLNIDMRALDGEVPKSYIVKNCWELPNHITWGDVLSEKLTVVVPSGWSFDKMIAGLAEQPLVSPDAIFIGSSLHAENRFPLDQSWVVSAKESDGGPNEIRVLKSDGQVMQPAELVRYRVRKRAEAGGVSRASTTISRRGDSPYAIHRGGSGSTFQRQEEARETDHTGQAESIGTTEIERLFEEYCNLSTTRGKADNLDLMRRIKKLLQGNHQPLVEAQTRLLLLLTPAAQSIPSDVIVAWHYLLSEILLSHHRPSKWMLDEWVNRVYRLEEITAKNMSRPPDRWRDELKEACEAFRELLQGLQ